MGRRPHGNARQKEIGMMPEYKTRNTKVARRKLEAGRGKKASFQNLINMTPPTL